MMSELCSRFVDLYGRNDPETELLLARVVTELPPRFRCIVRTEAGDFPAYIPFSSKVSKHIRFVGETVLVRSVGSPSHLEVVAILFSGTWVLIDLRLASSFFFEFLVTKFGNTGAARREVPLAPSYRADFLIGNRIVELKTVLTDQEVALYPLMKLARAEKQLASLTELLYKGYEVEIAFLVLAQSTQKIVINPKFSIFQNAFSKLVENGMMASVYRFQETGTGRLEVIQSSESI